MANPGGYLRTTVVNACRDLHRHRAVVRRTPLPIAEPAIAEHDELFDALAALPWRQQAALVLRFHVDLSDADIAVALDCRQSTVRSIIRRALASLRKELQSRPSTSTTACASTISSARRSFRRAAPGSIPGRHSCGPEPNRRRHHGCAWP